MKNILLNRIPLLGLLLLLLSCATDGTGEITEPLDQYSLALLEIDHYLEKGEALKAMESVLYYQDIYDSEETAFLELYDETIDEIIQDLDSALENDFQNAVVLYRSLQALDSSLLSRYPEPAEMDRQYVHFLLNEEYYASAFVYLRDTVGSMDLSREDMDIFAKAAIVHSQRALAVQLLEICRSNRWTVPEGLESLATAERSIDQYIDGTVTVWVDKGVKIERGVGYPDIVIGSAFFIDKTGYLLTNYHNIQSEVDPAYQGYSKLYVRLSEQSNEKIPARVIGWDPLLDLALIKIEMDAPYVFEFSSSGQINLGQSIMAIGSPGGLMRTVTSGTVSAKSRELLYYGSSYQVDVPVNPGNSGGPLLDMNGQVLGVVFAGIEQFEGINFAIPVYYAQEILTRLYQGGEVRHAWTGSAGVVDLNDFKMIYAVPDGASDTSGLLPGDTITSINNQPVRNVIDAQNVLIRYEPGTMVKVRYRRDQTDMETLLLLEERFKNPCYRLMSIDKRDNLILPFFGFSAEPITMRRRNKTYELQRIYPGTVGEFSGMTEGDYLQIIDWIVDDESKVVAIQAILESQKTGYLRTGLTIATPGDSNIFF